MPERFRQRILEHISDVRYDPRTADQLAKDLSVTDEDREAFGESIDHLLQEGTATLGSDDTLGLPPVGKEMVGTFRKHERGFGFLIPDRLTQHGDLFIPPGHDGGALTGDHVRANVKREARRGSAKGKSPFVGRIVEVLKRCERQYVGTLTKEGNRFVVNVDGKALHDPVLIRDPHAKNAKVGDKVAIDLTKYPEGRQNPEGVIVEVLGEAGLPDVETAAVMRAYGLPESFPEEVVEQARRASHKLDEDIVPEDREDLTDAEEYFICTIDPPDAKDYDDAISIRRFDQVSKDDRPAPNAAWELGVHIADVSAYIEPGSALDQEAYDRGNSTYLPRRVVPMLPEVLSNGVCSLQEGVNRFAKSCFITYDENGAPLTQRFSRSVIRSQRRLTYIEAQALIDNDLRTAHKNSKSDDPEKQYPRELMNALKRMDELAKAIRKRRMKEGMIVLGLPEVKLEFDDGGNVVDAHPADDSFTHTIIEMFMVEANEAAARLFVNMDVPMIRRVHPDPDAHDLGELRGFARIAGYNIPEKPTRKELQDLLEATRGKPAQQAVHMGVLRTLSKAEYKPIEVGHFALASDHYTHFTSPIRRYPDFIVHRGIDAFLAAVGNDEKLAGPLPPRRSTQNLKKIGNKVRKDSRVPDAEELASIGRHCSTTERNSEGAERELREYLVLELLSHHEGDDYAGTVSGVIGRGVFIQIDRYLIDGFVAISDLPGPSNDRWQLNQTTGALVAQRSGKTITIGDRFTVRVAKVDLPGRKMDLVIVDGEGSSGGGGGGTKKKSRGKSKDSGKKPKPKSKAKSGDTGGKTKKKSSGGRGPKKKGGG